MALKNKRTSIKDLEVVLDKINERLDKIEAVVFAEKKSINKIETFNGDVEPIQREKNNLQMDDRGKLASVKNAVQILPPNLKVNGRHTKENVGAICGFKVSEEMLDKAYQ